MATVVLVGTLDTKGEEYLWIKRELEKNGCTTVLIDVGTYSDGTLPDGSEADYPSIEVARAIDENIDNVRQKNDRGMSMTVMAKGSAALLAKLFSGGKVDAVLGVGGSSGSSVAASAMRALPIGVPKLLVSTMAAGDIRPYVGAKDITVMPSIVDIAGINRISRIILGNAVAAISAMAKAYVNRKSENNDSERPIVAASMFGVTTPAVDEARERLMELGYEVLVFHATGTGGQAMEALVEDGHIDGVLDLTTTELVDELLGGVLSAGPDRLLAAGKSGVPQVVSLGALDMCNFGPADTVPEKYQARNLVVHNPTVTLMRTTKSEMECLGREVAEKLANAKAPTVLFIPNLGVSAIDVEGGPFYDPEADEACFDAVKEGLAGTEVAICEKDMAINDPGFGKDAADALDHLIKTRNKTSREENE